MSHRSLWPREHGAYFQLAIPLVVACALRTPAAGTIALCAGAVLAFLSNEPLLVVLGHRGRRMRDGAGAAAKTRLSWLAGGALILGALGLALAPLATLAAAALAAVPAVGVVILAWRRAEHTLAGELAAAVALTGAAVPVLVASGGSLATALGLWLGWSIGFGAIVIAIHRVMARHKRSALPLDRWIAFGLLLTAAGAAIAAASSSTRVLWVAVPLASLAAVLAIAAPSASRLRAIGIATAVVASASGLGLVALA